MENGEWDVLASPRERGGERSRDYWVSSFLSVVFENWNLYRGITILITQVMGLDAKYVVSVGKQWGGDI